MKRLFVLICMAFASFGVFAIEWKINADSDGWIDYKGAICAFADVND